MLMLFQVFKKNFFLLTLSIECTSSILINAPCEPCDFDCFADFVKKQKYFDFFQIFVMSTISQVLFFDYSSVSHFNSISEIQMLKEVKLNFLKRLN